MNNLPVPDLTVLKTWLLKLGIEFFECESCQALHLPHMQNINGIFDAKIDLLDEDIIVFSAATEVRPTGLLPLVAGLSDINTQFSLVNGFVDVQDDNLPKLIVTHSLTAGAGLTLAQFQRFVLQTQQQIELFVENVKLKGFLFFPEEDEFSEQDKVLH
ncbi:YbjN domain-containing protein [Plesiomonas shigelloides]|uniref:YbjN domain-containing protein n=1 Tax=Plesiomonas shigelloides TaxID=703 RepID=UPI00288783C1|nr:YbjN domain-containing protein [Plesiomonas shigelloides]MDT1010026.1 YbjN domain-containing protein [Plesiomonas shigelloides]